MSQFYIHPEATNKLYDPTNYEYDLADSLITEHITMISPKILWWKLDPKTTRDESDDLDKLYGESQMYNFSNVHEPIEIEGYLERSAVIEELSRAGLAQTEEINLIVAKSQIHEKLGREPISGDIFRVSYLDKIKSKDDTYYTVVSVVNDDFFNWRQFKYIINAEQTALKNIPKKIVEYS